MISLLCYCHGVAMHLYNSTERAPKNQLAAVSACKQEVIQCRAGAADMQCPSWRWRKPHSDLQVVMSHRRLAALVRVHRAHAFAGSLAPLLELWPAFH